MREGWEPGTLGDLVEESISEAVERPHEYELLTVRLHAKGIVPSGKSPNQTAGGRKHYVRQPGEILVGRQNYHRRCVGRVPSSLTGFVTSNAISAFVAREGVDPDFALIAMQSVEATESAEMFMSGTGQKEISVKSLLSVPFRIPPLEEQRRIVDLIGSLDDAIEAANGAAGAAQRTADELRAAHFEGARGGWESIESLAEVIIGKQKNAKGDGQPPVPYLRAANLSGGRFDLSDISTMPFTVTERSRMGVEAGDVLIVEGGGGYGHSAMWPGTEHPFVGIQNSILRLRARPDKALPGYLLHWAKWARESGYFEDSMTSTTIPHLSLARVRAMTIPSTGVEDQEQIVSAMDAAVATADSTAVYAETLSAARSELLTVLLSGEHEIPESYDVLTTGSRAA